MTRKYDSRKFVKENDRLRERKITRSNLYLVVYLVNMIIIIIKHTYGLQVVFVSFVLCELISFVNNTTNIFIIKFHGKREIRKRVDFCESEIGNKKMKFK